MSTATVRGDISTITNIFAAHAPRQRWSDRTEICRQGESAEHVFLLEEGLVICTVSQANGREMIVGTRSPLSIIGAECALLMRPFSVTATTVAQSYGRCVSTDI